jgi:fibronectin type 3 domain-containing protein
MTGRRGFRFPTSAALLAAVLSLAFFAPGAVPSPWTDADVGGPGQAGNATYDNTNGTWVLTGGGWDVWGTADAFNYAYMPVNGDTVITAHIAKLTDSTGGTTEDQWSKAGPMFRDGTGGGAMFAFECFTGNNGTDFQFRTTTGGGAANNGQTGAGAAHAWLRITRTGNAFQGAWSDNGTAWTNHGAAQTIAMPAAALVGIAVCAHNNGTVSIATFDNVQVTTGTGTYEWPTPAPTNVAATPNYNQISLTWTAVTGATSYTVWRLDPGAANYAQVGAPTTNSFVDNGVTYPNSYTYVVTATNPSVGTSIYSSPAVVCEPLQPPITVSPGGPITTTETGGNVTLTLQVNAVPTSAVTVTITSSNTTGATVGLAGQVGAQSMQINIPTSTPVNSTFPFVVYGVDDQIANDPQTYTITMSIAGGGYTNPPTLTVNGTTLEGDTAGLVVNPLGGLTTTTAGGQATINVSLNSKPASGAVSVSVTSSNTTEGTVSTSVLNFSSSNWMNPQPVVVTGQGVNITYINTPYTVDLAVQAGSSSEYLGMVASVSVTNLHLEIPPALPQVWGKKCGLLGLEGFLPLMLLPLWRRRRRTVA